MRVLLADSDPEFATAARLALRSEALVVDIATEAVGVLERAVEVPYDALVIDLAMPGAHGVDLLKRLQRNGVTAPILVLVADTRPEARIKALHLGADDCLVKPVLLAELTARVHALTRRAGRKAGCVLEVEDLVLHCDKRRAFRAGRALLLTEREFAALAHVVRAHGKPVSTGALFTLLRPDSEAPIGNFISVLMMRVRRKVDDGHGTKLVRTIRGAGYAVAAPAA